MIRKILKKDRNAAYLKMFKTSSHYPVSNFLDLIFRQAVGAEVSSLGSKPKPKPWQGYEAEVEARTFGKV